MIGAGAGLVVGKIVPGIAIFAVVLANSTPLPLTQIWPPLLPRHSLVPRLIQAYFFCCFDQFRTGTPRQCPILHLLPPREANVTPTLQINVTDASSCCLSFGPGKQDDHRPRLDQA